MFVGVVLVAHFDGAAPGGGQTVLSQSAHRSVGSGAAYGFVQVATTLVLLVAANSAFNGFPRLLYVMARDGFAPRVFLRMGDRFAFTNGILVLAVPAALIYAAFGGQTGPLISLFAIGVFLAFTLAQSGMVAHWWRHRERGWRAALATNLRGAVLSAVVIAAITKLTQGAWVVVVLVPLIVVACWHVHDHYQRAHEALTPRPESGEQTLPVRLAPPRARAGGLRAPDRGTGRSGRGVQLRRRPNRRTRLGCASRARVRRLPWPTSARRPREPHRGRGRALPALMASVG
jgi:amino acid transporter